MSETDDVIQNVEKILGSAANKILRKIEPRVDEELLFAIAIMLREIVKNERDR